MATSSRTSTETQTSSSRGGNASRSLDAAQTAEMDSDLRVQLFRSLTRIERHLKRRDPEALRRISDWYSAQPQGEAVVAAAAREGGWCVATGSGPVPTESRQQRRRRRQRRMNGRPKRVQQSEIDNSMLEYLKIPKGVAARSLLVPPQPDWLFADDEPPTPPVPNEPPPVAGFRWLLNDSNASNAGVSSRRLMERELIKQKLDMWVFLFFRVLRRNWESVVVEEKKATADGNLYAEETIGKWTKKMRLKIMRQAPMKVALNAFLSRLGLINNASIVFCRDGFYGLMDVGNAYGDVTKTPCAMISFSSTPRYLGFKNGDSIYVNSCSASQRQMMEEAPRQDVPKKYQPKRLSLDIEEEGEFDCDLSLETSSLDALDFDTGEF